MEREPEPPSAKRINYLERDAPTMQVDARCRCKRGVYFRYAVAQDRELVVEDISLHGPAALRCVGCGDEAIECPCVPI